LLIENDNNIKSSLVWSVVESIPVHEDIKLGRENNQRYVNVWTRTDLKFHLPNGGYALRFDQQKFAALIFYIIF
jgi:mannonate dehydratase